jgi:putative membrane protein (TIGR04086 family)
MSSGATKIRVKSPLLAGLIYILLIVFTGTLITSLLLSISGIQESSLPYFAYTIHILALLVGGWIAGKRAGEKGWYYGGMSGLLYALLLTLTSFLGNDHGLGLDSLLILLASSGSGALGGIFGVNMRR